MSSSRLPGKHLKIISHYNLIEHIILSIKSFKLNGKIFILTSTQKEDDVFEEIAKKSRVNIFRGDLEDVSKRTSDLLKLTNLEYFFRVNGDSPILIEELYKNALKIITLDKYDIISNIICRTFPYGISIELIRSKTFLKYYEIFNEKEKEHITQFFYKNLNLLNYFSIISSLPLSNCSKKFSVDTMDDLLFLRKIFLKQKDNFNLKDLKYLCFD